MSTRRARKPAAFYLKTILKPSTPGVYKLEEDGITYELTYEQFNDLKAAKTSVALWYNNLDRFSKKRVIRHGFTQTDDNGFYPDAE